MSLNWEAIYKDGTSFVGKYADIDRDRLSQFNVYYKDRPSLSVEIPKGASLIWRKRTIKENTPLAEIRFTSWIIWTVDDETGNPLGMWVILPDGLVIPPKPDVQRLDCEKR